MTKAKLSTYDAILSVLGNGKRQTLDQIVTRISKKVAKPSSPSTVVVRISELRRMGHTIVTYRGGQSKARDGATQYQLVS